MSVKSNNQKTWDRLALIICIVFAVSYGIYLLKAHNAQVTAEQQRRAEVLKQCEAYYNQYLELALLQSSVPNSGTTASSLYNTIENGIKSCENNYK